MIRSLVFFVQMVALSFAACAGWPNARSAAAACRVRTHVAEATAVVVTPVPVAVAVGVPVAEATPYYYSYSAYAYSPPATTIDVDALAAKLAEKLTAGTSGGGSNSQPNPPAPNPVSPPNSTPAKAAANSIVAQKCASCHSGVNPKGAVSLENLSTLDCTTRLKAIRAVLSEKMPQAGTKLTPEEAGRVLEELAGQ